MLVLVNADFYDENGNLSVRITHNEFHLISGQYSYRDRSEDRSELAVYNKAGKEMLYLRYINPKAVVLRGLFSSPDGTTISIDDERVSLANAVVVAMGCKGGFDKEHAGFAVTRRGFRM
jgi:hypothetical protein